jgi:hypothetical protein
MLDVIGTIAGIAIYALLVGVIAVAAPGRATKTTIIGVAVGWGALIVAMAARGALAPGSIGPVPAPVLLFAAALVLLFGSWFVAGSFRGAVLGVPLPVLVAVNVTRLAGVFFLLLAADGRLSAPFAPVAGGGDMLVGALAIPVAAMAASRAGARRGWLVLWNALGALDLAIAITLGALSAPGAPFRIFANGPGTAAMGTLPWTIVPTTLVPLFLLIHFAIVVRVASRHAVPRSMATAV